MVVVILCYFSVASSCAVWASSAMCNHGSCVQQCFWFSFFVDKPSPSDVAVQFLFKALFFPFFSDSLLDQLAGPVPGHPLTAVRLGRHLLGACIWIGRLLESSFIVQPHCCKKV